MSTAWRRAAKGTIPCFICHRYQPADKLENGRCKQSCLTIAATMPNRAPKMSRRKWARMNGGT